MHLAAPGTEASPDQALSANTSDAGSLGKRRKGESYQMECHMNSRTLKAHFFGEITRSRHENKLWVIQL
jgi:hypothetical protein